MELKQLDMHACTDPVAIEAMCLRILRGHILPPTDTTLQLAFPSSDGSRQLVCCQTCSETLQIATSFHMASLCPCHGMPLGSSQGTFLYFLCMPRALVHAEGTLMLVGLIDE